MAGASGGSNIVASDLAFAEGEALRVEDVMRILHLSRNTVYKLAREGTLPSFKVGRQIRFRYDDVRARLESTAAVASPSPGSASGAAAPIHAPGAPIASCPSGVAVSGSAPEPLVPTALPPVSSGEAASCPPSVVPAAPVAPCPPATAAVPLDQPNPNDLIEELPSWARGSVVVGGQSLAGDVLANYLSGLGVKVLRSHANAYVSLARMYLGSCHAAVVDLWSERDRAYNTPYVRRFLPGVPALAFRLYKQRMGFTVAARNPRSIATWSDLLAPGVQVANRERGAGTRVLLDEKLKYLEARGDRLAGYNRPVNSELAQALLVARGLADVAVTSEKPAQQVKGLTFIPLQDETCDLVVLNVPETAPFIKAVRSLLRTEAFRREFDPALYDTRLMGEIVYEC